MDYQDDDPSEKYEVILDWNNPEAVIYISEKEYELILRAQESKKTFVQLSNRDLVNVATIKQIHRKKYWRSAEEKKIDDAASELRRLWWNWIHEYANKSDEKISFRDYLKRERNYSDEKIDKIKTWLAKIGNTEIVI